jgi:hypothetical protein
LILGLDFFTDQEADEGAEEHDPHVDENGYHIIP